VASQDCSIRPAYRKRDLRQLAPFAEFKYSYAFDQYIVKLKLMTNIGDQCRKRQKPAETAVHSGKEVGLGQRPASDVQPQGFGRAENFYKKLYSRKS
jgi:hypothetical protein